jgi:hypothetical protein
MKRIDPQTYAYLQRAVPEWIKAVDRANEQNLDFVILSLDAFADDPQLLFKALWYAHDQCMAVLFASKAGEDSSGSTMAAERFTR